MELKATDRLLLLLPWVNGADWSSREIREGIWSFLEPHLGKTAGGLEHRGWTRTLRPSVNNEIFGRDKRRRLNIPRLRRDLKAVMDGELDCRLPSLRFTVVPWKEGQRVVAVDGRVRDLVLYQAMRLLTTPGMVVLARCPAPAPWNWREQCENWVMTRGGRRGRSRIFCSDRCRVRASRRREGEERLSARRLPARSKTPTTA